MAIETSFIARGCSEKQDSFIVSNRFGQEWSSNAVGTTPTIRSLLTLPKRMLLS